MSGAETFVGRLERVARARGARGWPTFGAAIMYLCDAERNAIVTPGVARRSLEGAQLRRLPYEDSATAAAAKALDFPLVPWIARRLGPAAKDDAAMLPVLAQIERVMSWT